MSLRRTTRRSFIGAAGAALSAPLAAAGPALRGTGHRRRRRDSLDISQAYAAARHRRRLRERGGAVRRSVERCDRPRESDASSSDGFGEHDAIAMAAGRADAATAVLHCTVEIESAIGPACTLVEMARQQGGGVTRHTERGVFELACVRGDGAWTIQRACFRTDDLAGWNPAPGGAHLLPALEGQLTAELHQASGNDRLRAGPTRRRRNHRRRSV